jgi:hypothetical protein
MNREFIDFEIECPNCKTKFSLSSVVSDKLRERLQDEIEQNITRKIEKVKQTEIEEQKRLLQSEYDKKIEEFQKKFLEEQGKQKQLQTEYELKLQRAQQESEIKMNRLLKEQELMLESLRKQFEDAQNELERRNKELEEARQIERELRKKEAILVEREKNIDIEVQRKISEERIHLEKLLQEQAQIKFQNEYAPKLREKDHTIEMMQKRIEELNNKLQLTSQQLQGEAQELLLEEKLQQRFPLDRIEPVPKGVRGADVVQEVFDRTGTMCGKIIWESKRTKDWNNDWIQKLKEDQREIGAEIAIIVTQAMPKDISSIGLLDGVWVCDFSSCIGLAMSLREHLIQLRTFKEAMIGKETKMEQIYNYICSEQFAQKIKAIVETFKTMKEDLDKERIAMEKHWKKREEELSKIMKNTVRIYGELEALIGNQLPEISLLQLPSGK